MQPSIVLQAFDGLDVAALCLERRVDATDDGCAFDEDGANAALGLGAADLGARQTQVFAQHLGEVARLSERRCRQACR